MSHSEGIIFGPWIGEFGWELFSWQAYCRSISRKYDKVIVISRPGNNFLYSDFCDEYIPYDPPTEGLADSHMNSSVKDFDVTEFLKASIPLDTLQMYKWTWLQPTKIGNPPYDHWRAPVLIAGFGDVIPEYRLYRKQPDEKIDIVIHARNRQIRELDNWSIDNWNELISLFPETTKIACIGKKSESLCLEGAVDARDISLEESVKLLSSATCIIGPSSGPMHLASLSGCPQVVWTSNPNQNFSRYKYCWNPFCVDVDMLTTDNPTPADVYSTAKKYIGT